MRSLLLASAVCLFATDAFAQLKTYVQYDAITGTITATVKSKEGLTPPNHGFFKQTEFEGWIETEGKKVNPLTRSLVDRQKKVITITDENGSPADLEVYTDDPTYLDYPPK